MIDDLLIFLWYNGTTQLTERGNVQNFTERQDQALYYLYKGFSDAWSNRLEIITNRLRTVPPGQPQSFLTQESIKKDNEVAKASYKKLFEALNNPEIKNHLAKDATILRSLLEKSIKENNFSELEDYFMNNTQIVPHEKGDTYLGPRVKLVKLGEIKMNNYKTTISSKLNDFGKKFSKALNSLAGEDRSK